MKRAFTVLELLVVIALIGILAYLLTINLYKMKQKAKLARVSSELSSIATSVTQYYQDNGYVYPPDAGRGVPPGLEKYLPDGNWPTSIWPHGVFDWDNWTYAGPDATKIGQKIYQISYRLCSTTDPVEYCSDPVLFPNFTQYSAIFNCISGPCVPHVDHPTDPGYCVNCNPKEVNY